MAAQPVDARTARGLAALQTASRALVAHADQLDNARIADDFQRVAWLADVIERDAQYIAWVSRKVWALGVLAGTVGQDEIAEVSR